MTAFEKYQKAIRRMKLGSRESENCWINSRMNSTDLMNRLILNSLPYYDSEKYGDPIDVLFALLFRKKFDLGIELAIIRQLPKEAAALYPEEASYDENKMIFRSSKRAKYSFGWISMKSATPARSLWINIVVFAFGTGRSFYRPLQISTEFIAKSGMGKCL